MNEAATRFLAFVEAGRTLEEAADAAGVAPRTAKGWVTRGRNMPSGPWGDFFRRLEEIRAGLNSTGLSEADVVRLLERSARKGNVPAMKLLLERPWERSKRDEQDEKPKESPLAAVVSLAERRTG